jgi:hypothetical protein
MQRCAGPNVSSDRRGQRLEQECRLADPVGQGRALELDPGAAIDDALPVQRGMVAILGHQHVGEEVRARAPALDRQRRGRRLDHGLALPAAHLGPDVDHHLEVRGHVFEELALVRAEPGQHGAAARGAGTDGIVHHPLARQVGWQRLTTAGAARAGLRGAPISSRVPARLLRGRLFLEIADQQLELLDPLRGATEAGALHERERRSQLLDVQRLGVDLGIARRELTVFGRERLLQRDRERTQGFRI